MIGAILGDMIGSPYEFDRGGKTKYFPLFGEDSRFTDDTVMTIAVAEGLMDSLGKGDDETKRAVIALQREMGIEENGAIGPAEWAEIILRANNLQFSN